MIAVYVVIGLVLLAGIGLAISYNRFIRQRTLIENSFANVDTELRRRYDLIPNLVETVKGYAAHERELFEEVTSTRASAAATSGQPAAAQAAAEAPFVQALGRLLAVAENYPQLRASENFQALQAELANTEDRIQASRRFYNANVQVYNQRVQAFPSALVAKTFRFGEADFFEIRQAERDVVARPTHVEFSGGGTATMAARRRQAVPYLVVDGPDPSYSGLKGNIP